VSRFATIIGAGPAGIATAIALKNAAVGDFLILERATTVGGTWANNTYPGLCCDVPSLVYEFSFERKVDWSRAFAPQPEILRYMRDVADKHGVTPHVRFQTEVTAAEWDEVDCTWTITTRDGWRTSSKVLIGAIGMFNQLNWPEIPGLKEFAGTTIHSGAWPAGGIDLADKSVAIIGAAASAVQMVPELVRDASSLYVFQRTANWIFPKEDPEYTKEELEEFRRNPASLNGPRDEIFGFFEKLVTYDQPVFLEDLRAKAMANLAAVEDPELRRKVVSTLPIGAQRPLFSNTFYPTLNEDHVELVTDAISHITPRGVVTADGRERKADTLIMATGYDTSRFLSVIDVTGQGGSSLAEIWSDGAYAYKGMCVPGFPNLFMLYGPNTNNGSIIRMLEYQAEYIVDKLCGFREEDLDAIEVRVDVTKTYNEKLQRDINAIEAWRVTGSRYYRSASGRIVTQWPGNMTAFGQLLAESDDAAFVTTPSAGQEFTLAVTERAPISPTASSAAEA